MSDFTTVNCRQSSLDPLKRVNYSLGMVLGVDEYQQEQIHFLHRDRLHNRMLHGYGRVSGLHIEIEAEDEQPVVVVHPGLAVDPAGQHICLPTKQCANLNDWLTGHREDVLQHSGSPPESLSLYAVLCYRECKTDHLPVPGGPCRSEDDATAPSRIAESFELKLAFEKPAQAEEDAVDRLGAWIRQIEFTTEDALSEDEVLEQFRQLFGDEAPLSPPPGSVNIDPNEAFEIIQAVLAVWTNEIRPSYVEGCGKVSDKHCVLLGELSFEFEDNGQNVSVAAAGSIPESVEVILADSPYLLSTRVLQELILSEMETPAHGPAGGDLTGEYPDPIVRGLQTHPVSDAAPNEKDVLTWDGTAWGPVSPSAATFPAADSDVTGTYPDLNVVKIQNRPVQNVDPGGQDVLTWDGAQWAPAPVPETVFPPANSDVLGTYPNLDVVQIQNRPVRNVNPNLNDVLTWDGDAWIPREVSGGPATGDFVLAPHGPYAVVAAGHFKPDGTEFKLVYGNLTAKRISGGSGLEGYLLHFDSYQDPTQNDSLRYVVCGTVHASRDHDLSDPSPERLLALVKRPTLATFQFVGFTPEGIVIQILIEQDNLRFVGTHEFGFMVQICAFGKEIPLP